MQAFEKLAKHCIVGFLFGPERRSQRATLVVLLVVVISSLRVQIPEIPKAFLICSGMQQNFAYTFVLPLPADLPSQIFHLLSN